jgi:rare lipoprotein A
VGGVPKRELLYAGLAAFVFAASSCATYRPFTPAPSIPPAPSPPPVGANNVPSIIGVASWYGPGFNGHKTANGEIYDQNDLTAASLVFPLDSRVMVTNLRNGRSVQVRINDRGPFVKGRKIDLSHAAARALGIVRPGTAPVRMWALSTPAGSRRVGAPLQYYVQVGSFSYARNAIWLRRRLASYYPDVRIDKLGVDGRVFYRVEMGVFRTWDDAHRRAQEVSRFGYPIIIVSE